MRRTQIAALTLLLALTACAEADPAPEQAAEFDLSGIGFEVHQEPG